MKQYEDYQVMEKIGIEKYNDAAFCSVVAVATVTGMSFARAHKKMSKNGNRKLRSGANLFDMFKVIESHGYKVRDIGYHNVYGRSMTLSEAAKLYDKGTYLISTKKHITAVVDGDINDHTNPERTTYRKKTSKAKVLKICRVTKI
jgi:hypothetical protein